jgi:tetratricopeptide (TPR) repeat protein
VGSGGMAVVYRARLVGPAGFVKTVALKVARHNSHLPPDQLQREALVHSAIRHPNVLRVLDLVSWQGRPVLVTEFVDGFTLAQLLNSGPRPDRSVARHIGGAIARGLAAVHAVTVPGYPTGLVHRDVKPANVLVSGRGQVLLADFGIACFVARADEPVGGRQVVGTPSYMSPEQARGEGLGPPSDVFSLGSLLFALYTGFSLFSGAARSARMLAVTRGLGPERRAQLRALGEPILERCVDLDPALRPSAAEVAEVLVGGAARAVRSWAAAHRPERASPRGLRDGQATAYFAGAERQDTNLAPRPIEGRAEELTRLAEILQEPGLVVLWGASGVGTSHVAAVAARALLDQGRARGAWLVRVRQAGRMRAEMGEQLECGEADLVELLGDGGPWLVVLDPAEPSYAAEVRALLAECPGLTLLCVAHQRWPGVVRQIRLGTFPLPDPDGQPEALRAHPCMVMLGAAPSRDLAVLVQIARWSGGVPVVLQLLGARLRLVSPRALLKRLGADPLQPSSALADGLAALPTWVDVALAQLALPPEPFDLELALGLLDLGAWPDAPSAPDALEQVVGLALVEVHGTPSAPRFSVLRRVRAAVRHLPSPAGLLLWAGRYGTSDAMDRPRRMRADAGNLAAAVRVALEAAQTETAWLALEPAVLGLRLRSGYADAASLLEACAGRMRRPERLAWVQLDRGRLAIDLGRPDEAHEALEAAVLALPEPWVAARALSVRALGEGRAGRRPQAEALAREAVRLAASADPALLAELRVTHAWTLQALGRPEQALELAGFVLEGLAAESVVRRASALNVVGAAHRLRGAPAEAVAAWRAALAMHRERDDRPAIAVTQGNLANAFNNMGRWADAASSAAEAVRLARRAGVPMVVAAGEVSLGIHAMRMQDHARALQHFESGRDVAARRGLDQHRRAAELNRVFALLRLGLLGAAERALEELEPPHGAEVFTTLARAELWHRLGRRHEAVQILAAAPDHPEVAGLALLFGLDRGEDAGTWPEGMVQETAARLRASRASGAAVWGALEGSSND